MGIGRTSAIFCLDGGKLGFVPGLPGAGARSLCQVKFRRFLHALILVPARVERRARGITIRLLGCHPTLDRLFGTWRMIESVGFT